jgi:hypothetical protein
MTSTDSALDSPATQWNTNETDIVRLKQQLVELQHTNRALKDQLHFPPNISAECLAILEMIQKKIENKRQKAEEDWLLFLGLTASADDSMQLI